MEEILYTARIHPKALFKAFLMALVLGAASLLAWKIPTDTGWSLWDSWGRVVLGSALAFLAAWYVLVPVLQWRHTIFTLTSERVRVEWGVLYKHSLEIDLQRIASISEERGLLDRLFRCGTLNFYDAAASSQPRTGGAWNKSQGESGVRFHDVPEVKRVRSLVEGAKYQARRSPDSLQD